MYFFTCDHGCKVFFDHLGVPWPQHQCLEYLTATYGREVVERGMEVMMTTPSIDRTYAQKVQQTYQREAQQSDSVKRRGVIRRDPSHGAYEEVIGIVQEVIHEVNAFKRAKIDNTPFFQRSTWFAR